jgi:hypothetical protein
MWNIGSFHGIHMESIWNQSMECMLNCAKQAWIPLSFHMEQSEIPYGIYHSIWNLSFHMEFIIPYGIYHSIWNLSFHMEFINGIYHSMAIP